MTSGREVESSSPPSRPGTVGESLHAVAIDAIAKHAKNEQRRWRAGIAITVAKGGGTLALSQCRHKAQCGSF